MATFTQKYFPKLRNTVFYKLLRPLWCSIKVKLGLWQPHVEIGIGRGQPAKDFFAQNKGRVEKVASLLSDEESKKTYLKIVERRQSSKYEFFGFPKCNPGNYFANSFFSYGKNEVLIDCGAFTGDTIEEFLKLPNMEYERIIAFEPEPENYRILENKFSESKFTLINAGAWNKEGELYFSGSGVLGIVSETPKGVEGEISIKVCSIDGLHLQEKVTFIKMDIEGSELNALIGAKETILRDKPKLAICIYHSNEDMVRIAEWIHELVPEYKLYVRYNMSPPYLSETVLYAVI
ncbi:MAG: FkbM family methyltransferase [Fibromonadaceae bacterium]|jgi:FkbM family methyltransferase|nr:FkbM family methyltransferase [Fibromonadaceae bacterium]